MVMLEDAPLSGHFGAGRRARSSPTLLRDARRRARLRRRARAASRATTRVERVVTASGRVVDADMVVMGTGAMPDVMLARAAELELGESGGVRVLAPTSRRRRAASGPPATCASTTRSCTAGRVRIEHYEVARAQGARRGRGDARDARGRTPRCRTSGPTSPTGRPPSGSGSPRRPSTRSSAAASDDGAFSVLHVARRPARGRAVGRARRGPRPRAAADRRRHRRRRPRGGLAAGTSTRSSSSTARAASTSGSSTKTSTPRPVPGSTWDMNDWTRRPVRRSTADAERPLHRGLERRAHLAHGVGALDADQRALGDRQHVAQHA